MIPIILIYLLRFCGAQPPEVKYVLILDSQMECCDEKSERFVDTSEVNVRRLNDNFACMHGNITFLKEIGPDTMMEIIVQKEASGKYEIMFTHEICDFCGEVAKGSESDYHSYIKYFEFPDECPFPAGYYPIEDFMVDTDDFPLNSNTAGRYQALLNLYKNPDKDCKNNKEFMFCLNLKLVVEKE